MTVKQKASENVASFSQRFLFGSTFFEQRLISMPRHQNAQSHL